MRSDFRRLLCAPLFACLAVGVIGIAVGAAHGGPPLRLGVTADPVLSAVARLTLVHLREGVGFAVDWREFPDEGALRAAFAGGKLDIAVARTEPGAPAVASAGQECPRERLVSLGAALRERWGGEAFILDLPPGPTTCAMPALVITRTVLEDLRFGILRKEAGRLAAFITQGDVTSISDAAGRGGERAATAAARAVLAAKAKR